MPIFHKKTQFRPRERVGRFTQCKKFEGDIAGYENIYLKLKGKDLQLIDRDWIITNGEPIDDVVKLNNRISCLEEENNLNKIKVEILLTMIADIATNDHL